MRDFKNKKTKCLILKINEQKLNIFKNKRIKITFDLIINYNLEAVEIKNGENNRAGSGKFVILFPEMGYSIYK